MNAGWHSSWPAPLVVATTENPVEKVAIAVHCLTIQGPNGAGNADSEVGKVLEEEGQCVRLIVHFDAVPDWAMFPGLGETQG